MSSIGDIAKAIEAGKREYENVISEESHDSFRINEIYGIGRASCDFENIADHKDLKKYSDGRIALGDNLSYMKFLMDDENLKNKFQLIYADPPFFSKSKYQASVYIDSPVLGKSPIVKAEAYSDIWNGDLYKYLKMLAVRIFMMRDLLSDRGCIVLHLDWHVVHYAKIMMDEIFGRSRFVNEIIWTYKSGGTNKMSFSKKHDVLLVYSKSSDYKFNPLKEKSYNRDYKPYRFKGVEEFCDEKGWYTLVNMKDVWNIDMVGRTSSERTGYATQKPEKLIERIIKAFSDEGDLCGDFFAGSGTFGAVCSKLNRYWVMCDSGNIANSDEIMRMLKLKKSFVVELQDNKVNETEVYAELDLKEKSLKLRKYILKDMGKFECLNRKDLMGMQNYLKQDSLSFIKFWSVDFNFDGEIHRADRAILDKKRVVNNISFDKNKNISLLGYDLLGNRCRWVCSREEN